jgi:YD repeat-containing protein
MLAALAACGAPPTATSPTPPAAAPSTAPVAGYCPQLDTQAAMWPWMWELFPACSPPPLRSPLARCVGPCPLPCRTDVASTATGPDQPPRGPTRFTYDERGRFVSSTRDGFPSLSCTWRDDRLDACRDPEAETLDDTDALVIRAVRDPAGRLTAVVAGDTTFTIARDAAGTVTAIDDTTFEYDAAGRLVTIANSWSTESSTIAYDLHGRPTTVTDETGALVAYQYDAQGRFTALQVDTHHGVTVAYDDRGRLSTLVYGSPFESTTTYTLIYDCTK